MKRVMQHVGERIISEAFEDKTTQVLIGTYQPEAFFPVPYRYFNHVCHISYIIVPIPVIKSKRAITFSFSRRACKTKNNNMAAAAVAASAASPPSVRCISSHVPLPHPATYRRVSSCNKYSRFLSTHLNLLCHPAELHAAYRPYLISSLPRLALHHRLLPYLVSPSQPTAASHLGPC